MKEDKNQVIKFDKCPNCGSTDRLVGRLVRAAKDKGQAREEWEPCMQIIQGVVVDPMRQSQILIGQNVPAYTVFTDVCMKCGTFYAILVQTGTAKATPQIGKLSLDANKPSPGIAMHN